MKKIILLFSLPLLFSCDKKEEKQRTVNGFADCHANAGLDSLTIVKKLQGTWQLKQQSCFWSGEQDLSGQQLFVTFHLNQYQVSNNGKVIGTGEWGIGKESTGNFWEMKFPEGIKNGNPYLLGNIFICDNEVLFNYSYIDMCDNYFRKVE